jgi:multiple sugar transport system ATP-binding protein
MGEMVGVRLRNVSKKAEALCPVFDVNLEVADKEFVTLLAPSGSGKTTTLRMIAGLEVPDEGEIYIGDQLVNDLSPAERDTAMVFQTYALYPHLTVHGNLASPLRARKTPQDEMDSRVKDVADVLGIAHLLEKYPTQLSGGEMQRVAIGRAIIRRPRVYLLDEPLTNLDAKLRVHMRAELKRLQKELGQTMIYATHDELEALSMSDRIAVMRNGRIVQYGTSKEIFEHPKNLSVATFVGTPTMNLFECILSEKAGRAHLESKVFKLDITELAELFRDKATGSEFILGIRPSDLQIHTEKTGEDFIQGEIYVLEPMGAALVIDVKVEEELVKVKVPGSLSLELGTKVWLTFDKGKMHIFSKKTKETIV